jgi:hypothetical protein
MAEPDQPERPEWIQITGLPPDAEESIVFTFIHGDYLYEVFPSSVRRLGINPGSEAVGRPQDFMQLSEYLQFGFRSPIVARTVIRLGNTRKDTSTQGAVYTDVMDVAVSVMNSLASIQLSINSIEANTLSAIKSLDGNLSKYLIAPRAHQLSKVKDLHGDVKSVINEGWRALNEITKLFPLLRIFK